MYLSGSVGSGGKNRDKDVLVAQFLLSSRGQWMSPAMNVLRTGKSGDDLEAGIKRFQKEVLAFNNPDGRIDAPGKTLRTDPNLRKILFNDKEIYSKYANVKYYKGHHNHLHVSFQN